MKFSLRKKNRTDRRRGLSSRFCFGCFSKPAARQPEVQVDEAKAPVHFVSITAQSGTGPPILPPILPQPVSPPAAAQNSSPVLPLQASTPDAAALDGPVSPPLPIASSSTTLRTEDVKSGSGSQPHPAAASRQQDALSQAVAMSQLATHSSDAALPVVSWWQHVQISLCALLHLLLGTGLRIQAGIIAYWVTAMLSCTAFGRRAVQSFKLVKRSCSCSLLYHWAAARKHMARAALLAQACWSKTWRTVSCVLCGTIAAVRKSAIRIHTAAARLYMALCTAMISCVAAIIVACTAVMSGGRRGLQISFSMLPDWRLVLGVVGSAALMAFGWCLMERLWDLSCKMVQAAACVIVCYCALQVRAVASLTLSFSAAMTPISAVSSAIRTRCTAMYDSLDLTGSQRRHYMQQLQDMQKLNDHHMQQQEQSRNLLWEKDSLIAQQQEQLRNMEASLLKKSEEASSMQTQLRSAHDQLQKRKQAFSQVAHPVSSLKLQSASGQPAQAMKEVQAPSASRPTNSRLAVGKAAAVDQPVSAMANLVPVVAPQPMFKSNLEAGIKAPMAKKAKELKQKSHKAGSLDPTHQNLSAEEVQQLNQRLSVLGPRHGSKAHALAKKAQVAVPPLVQGKAAAADHHIASRAKLVSRATPQPMPKSDLKASIKAALADKVKQLQQMADKDGGNLSAAFGSLVRETAELEGQAAHVHFMNKEKIMPEGQCSHTLLQETATLVSCDYDSQARKKYAAACGQEQAGSWKWVASPFSRAVRTLAPPQAVAAQLGQGGRSLGFVNYAEVLLANGQVVPCALKKLNYSKHSGDQLRANAELAGLRDAEGCPHLAQCYGAFEGWCPEEKQHCLWLVMQYAEGLSFQEAYRQLHKLQAEDEYSDMHYIASKLLMQHVLKGLEWLHKRGRAICDLKPDNIRVQMGQQPGTFAHVTLIDLGGSVKYKGPLMWVPTSMGHNLQHLCPEIARDMPLEVLDCCSHDMWGAGCLMHTALAATSAWAIPLVASRNTNYASLSKLHEVWAQALTVPDAVATCSHPLLSNLQRAVPSRAYPQAAALLVQLLQPDMDTRATAQQALASHFFTQDR